MLYIGIDLGTSACKFLLTDEKGTILNIVSEEYPLEFPHAIMGFNLCDRLIFAPFYGILTEQGKDTMFRYTLFEPENDTLIDRLTR